MLLSARCISGMGLGKRNGTGLIITWTEGEGLHPQRPTSSPRMNANKHGSEVWPASTFARPDAEGVMATSVVLTTGH